MSGLSKAQCILLACHYATQSDIQALDALLAQHSAAFGVELLYRILLTYLPENCGPSLYVDLIRTVADGRPGAKSSQAKVDVTPLKGLTPAQASRRVRKLNLLSLEETGPADGEPLDLLARFIIPRAYRIEAETGLLDLIPPLVEPFIDRSVYLRSWFVSEVLPILRLSYEYYLKSDAFPTLVEFSKLKEGKAVDVLLANSLKEPGDEGASSLARDLRCAVGPWVYGQNWRKRRKVEQSKRRASISFGVKSVLKSRLELPAATEQTEEGSDWEYIFQWMADCSTEQLRTLTNAVEQWNGPLDVSLGGYVSGGDPIDDERKNCLKLSYVRASLSCCYLASRSPTSINTTYEMLARLFELLEMTKPPPLTSEAGQLPSAQGIGPNTDTISRASLQRDAILDRENPLTSPSPKSLHLLLSFVFSGHVIASYDGAMSISDLIIIRFFARADEHVALVERIIHNMAAGQKRSEQEWANIRKVIVWLRDWGVSATEGQEVVPQGVFWRVSREKLEREILRAFLLTSYYSLAIKTYIEGSQRERTLGSLAVEEEVLATVMFFYDNASNGNRTRGGLRKASDILSVFQPYYAESTAFQQCLALMNATHALSFYSLTLQHGVPFQPISIRVSKDPLMLLRKVLEQNPHSYTKLDDMISIATNLVEAGLDRGDKGAKSSDSEKDPEARKQAVERRVTGMAIEAALDEDDFETAYSYVVTHLQLPAVATSGTEASTERGAEDDTSWQAAFTAGKYKPSLSSSQASAGPQRSGAALRRLEQKMELLSQALILAPSEPILDILAAWRQCEEEFGTLLASVEAQDDPTGISFRVDQDSDLVVPGGYMASSLPSFASVQPAQRSTTRIKNAALEEAPMGLFDVARGAAAAFSRSAFQPTSKDGPSAAAAEGAPTKRGVGEEEADGQEEYYEGDVGGRTGERGVRGNNRPVSTAGSNTSDTNLYDADGRTRKRDMVANAVTDGLVSSIGWVLGAKAIQQS